MSNSLRPMSCSMPGLPVYHQLPEFTQTHADWVGDAIQPSHPLSSPSPPALSLSQHRGLFQWVSSSHQVAKVLEFQFQHHLFTLFLSSERIASWHEYSDWLLLSPAFMKAGLCYLIHWNNPWDRVSAQLLLLIVVVVVPLAVELIRLFLYNTKSYSEITGPNYTCTSHEWECSFYLWLPYQHKCVLLSFIFFFAPLIHS